MRHRRIGLALIALLIALPGALPAVASASPPRGFAGDQIEDSILGFTLGADQTLAPNGSSAAGDIPWFEAISPNGRYLYAANSYSNTVSQFTIENSGLLAAMNPATLPTGRTPLQPAVSPDGRNLYLASSAGGLGVYDINSDGTLTLKNDVSTHLSGPSSVAVSPDGASVYVGDDSGNIVEFDRADNGALKLKPTATIGGPGTLYVDLAITPDGKYLYGSSASASAIDEYKIGKGGQLSRLSAPTVATGSNTRALIVSPNGRNVYTATCPSDGGIHQYAVQANGELKPLNPATVGSSSCGMPWMTANGASFYEPDDTNVIYQYNVSPTGALTPKSAPTVTDSQSDMMAGFVISPDQSPTARFSARPGRARKATKFNASRSAAPGGQVTSYRWNFGDGRNQTTHGPSASHAYRKAGRYTVTLTVSDDWGCSTDRVFTGQTAYCNGSKSARASHVVEIRKPKRRR